MPTEAVAPIEHTAPTAQSARGDPAGVRERLRGLIRSIEQRPARPRPPPPRDACAGPPLDAQSRATALGECLYREVRYDLDFAFGHEPLGGVQHAAGPLLALLAPAEDVERAAAADLLFLDIETSALGGAGATTFLVAAARLEAAPAPALVLRQYLAPSPAAEAALLSALVEDARLAGEPVLVTYNGRSFDAPVLDGRLTMHRQRGAFEALRPRRPVAPLAADLPRATLAAARHDRGRGARLHAPQRRRQRRRDPGLVLPLPAQRRSARRRAADAPQRARRARAGRAARPPRRRPRRRLDARGRRGARLRAAARQARRRRRRTRAAGDGAGRARALDLARRGAVPARRAAQARRPPRPRGAALAGGRPAAARLAAPTRDRAREAP